MSRDNEREEGKCNEVCELRLRTLEKNADELNTVVFGTSDTQGIKDKVMALETLESERKEDRVFWKRNIILLVLGTLATNIVVAVKVFAALSTIK